MTEEKIETFNIGDEFKIVDSMEDGAIIQLSKDAFVKVRYVKSKRD